MDLLLTLPTHLPVEKNHNWLVSFEINGDQLQVGRYGCPAIPLQVPLCLFSPPSRVTSPCLWLAAQLPSLLNWEDKHNSKKMVMSSHIQITDYICIDTCIPFWSFQEYFPSSSPCFSLHYQNPPLYQIISVWICFIYIFHRKYRNNKTNTKRLLWLHIPLPQLPHFLPPSYNKDHYESFYIYISGSSFVILSCNHSRWTMTLTLQWNISRHDHH